MSNGKNKAAKQKDSPDVLWMSRHEPLPVQVDELRKYFTRMGLAKSISVQMDERPFDSASEIAKRFQKSGAREMVVVAPYSVLDALVKLGIKPIRARMRLMDPHTERFNPYSDVKAGGRWYRHAKLERVDEFRLVTHPIMNEPKGELNEPKEK